MNTEPKFYNKNKELTKYSFACGYCEVKRKGDNDKTLYKEHYTYHVQSKVNNVILWLTFDNNQLTLARKQYRSIKL